MFSNQLKSLYIDGCKILWYDLDKTTSTMDYAVEINREGYIPWTVISADEQTSGRGTQGRTWFSPVGKGLWISVILPPPVKAEYLSDLSVLAANALVQSFKKFTKVIFSIKHPNDVTVNGRKIAGILFESATNDEKVSSVILGMGINFRQSVKDFEREGLFDATSFQIEVGFVPERKQLITSFLQHFKPMYEKSILKADVNNSK